MTLADLPLGAVLHGSGEPMRHVYFPLSGLVSLFYTLQDGKNTELAVVGDDGYVGVEILLGASKAPYRAVVQIAGRAYRVEHAAMLEAFRHRPFVQRAMLRYVQALITQMSLAAVCNRHHTVEQQLCRWLLLTMDRVAAREVRMTQELLGDILGVRRGSITQAAANLRDAGLISYERGLIRVADRGKLQAHGCECYGVLKKEADHLLRPLAAVPA